MTKSTSIAPIHTGEIVEFNAVLPPSDVQEMMRKEMDGLRMPSPPRIKVPAGGGIAFEVPGDDPENPDSMKELNCVILAHHPVNRYYIKGMDEGAESGVSPDCVSYDGKTGYGKQDATGTVLKTACAECPFNVFGSGKGGVGKACSNRHRLYLLVEGKPVPYIFEVPPSSVKALNTYIYNLLTYRWCGTTSVVTKLSLKKAENKSGIKYAELQVSYAGKLPPDLAMAAQVMGCELSKLFKEPPQSSASSDFVPLDENEDTPFNPTEVF